MLVAGSIFEFCKFHELFAKTELKGRCAVVSSYAPTVDQAQGASTDDGETDGLVEYDMYPRHGRVRVTAQQL